jgi:hypothetical protein
MENKPAEPQPGTTGEVIDALGGRKIAAAVRVSEATVRNKRYKKVFPAWWRSDVEALGTAHGFDVPSSLFHSRRASRAPVVAASKQDDGVVTS